jgi:hypothetical protein
MYNTPVNTPEDDPMWSKHVVLIKTKIGIKVALTVEYTLLIVLRKDKVKVAGHGSREV